MTEYWVSQGNKWCDFCKIFISNNPSSIRNHELGQRHKDSVTQRLDNMRKDGIKKEKDKKEAAKALEQIEAKANRSYQKDMATLKDARDSNVLAFDNDSATSREWEYDTNSGYYHNQNNGFYYDPNSGFYYSDTLGKWVTQEEALATAQVSDSDFKKEPVLRKSLQGSSTSQNTENKSIQSGPPPGVVISASLNPTRTVKGAPSSLTVGKRKRPDEKAKAKPKVVSEEEAAALKAREAAKKRIEDREKPLLGLYKQGRLH